MAFVAASVRCRSRLRSSGCIEGSGGRDDRVAEVGTEVLGCSELNLAPKGVFEFEFHLRKVEEAGCVTGLELDEEVDVAVRSEVLAQDGAVEGDPTDAVSGCEGGDEVVVQSQPGSQFHAAMMPHC